jgi:CRISPR-associated exonuclease Cas4
MIFLLTSIAIRGRVHRQKKQYHLHDATLSYSDLHIPAKALFSKRYRLAGKPDYIIKKHHQYIPIEMKSGSYPVPQTSHILQLAAYCQLVEEAYKTFVPYGMIIYRDGDFRIPFDPKLRFQLESVIKEMRQILKSDKVVLNHHDPRRCRSCSMRQYCTQRLN